MEWQLEKKSLFKHKEYCPYDLISPSLSLVESETLCLLCCISVTSEVDHFSLSILYLVLSLFLTLEMIKAADTAKE